MNRRRPPRSRAARPVSVEAVQSKLSRIVSHHEQLKVAFSQLHSQIRTGLLEAEDVFASLAVPLMKLVGLKTDQMATEGRFSTIATSIDLSHSQEENYICKAIMTGNEMMEKQKLQLTQLISLLKRIEAQVNSSQNSIFQNLSDHQAMIKKLFLKAFAFVSSIHHSNQGSDLSYMMLKILKVTFNQVGVALGSVEAGVDDLIHELAGKMCNPMVEYVHGLKVEMKTGRCSHLLEVLKEMDGVMKVREFELEEARKQARLAEQSRIEALSKLKRSEETARKLTTSLGLLIGDSTESEENLPEEKEDQGKDESLLWELLRKKRKSQSPASPLGPQELLGIGTCSKKLNLTKLIQRPETKLQPKRQSALSNGRLLLGSSPSATTQKIPPRKRVTP